LTKEEQPGILETLEHHTKLTHIYICIISSHTFSQTIISSHTFSQTIISSHTSQT